MSDLSVKVINAKFPKLKESQILSVLELTAEGATVPFIARYRKEKTGNLDEVVIRDIIAAKEDHEQLEKRREFVLKEIGEQGNLTDELKKRILNALDLTEVEEIYRPYKKKKKTKATVAREAGLQPLAEWIIKIGTGQIETTTSLEVKAKDFLKPAAGIVTYELALKGAQDIVVESISNETELRKSVKQDFLNNGTITSKKTKKFKANSKYEMYAEFEEKVSSLQLAKNSHRYMALRRGWQEGELAISMDGSAEELTKQAEAYVIKKADTMADDFLKTSAKLALTVYVIPSVSNEIHKTLKDQSDAVAINVFSENVRKLLLASPYGAKCVLALDPGIRTGCKVALVDSTGTFVSDTVLKIKGAASEKAATDLIGDVVSKITIDAIAVGNGTGGREAEGFMRKIIKSLGKDIPIIMVNESGASIYSASDIARQEFPDLDLTVRGAISIARRLQDPLSELVKIDPKSIGVGQYQHDVSQTKLKKSLNGVVESCVNNVGVDLNTASESLLGYVAGIGPTLAKNIIKHRSESGKFTMREELMNVERFSTKSFQQSAGFLRIPDGKMPLETTGIHPERYQAVKDMAKELGVGLADIMGTGAEKLLENRTKWMELIGQFTFDDIISELKKPGRDPRDPYKIFKYRDDIFDLKDVQKDMICAGVVTNVTNFGAFVDIGVHQDGLVHISELAHQFVDDPQKIVQPGDHVQVKVKAVDLEKKQLSLSMKIQDAPERKPARRPAKNSAGSQKVKFKDGDRPRGKGGKPKPGGRDRNQRPQRERKPFNNPFAALGDLNKK